jgi:signal transduction histidine kinase
MEEQTLTAKEKILIVEDEVLVAQHIEEQLEDFGYEVVSSVSYGELVSKEVTYQHPDLVLMDIMLKGEMNGIEAAHQLKSFSNVPVVFLTAYGDRKMFDKAKQTGPYGFLTKPFRSQELHAAIKLAISRYKEDVEHQIKNKISTENPEKRQERIKKALSSKKEALTKMNHELRTPLNVITGFGHLLGENHVDSLTEKQKDYVDSIVAAGYDLLDVVTGILGLAEIESGTMPVFIEKINITPLVNDAVKEMRDLAVKKGVRISNLFEIEEKILVYADERYLKQIIMNLVSNAIQYNKKEGAVLIEGGKVDGDKFQIRVRDTGCGIQSEKLDAIFEPFNRLEWEYSEIKGLGIGLSVAKGLLELMGGTIGVESEIDKGTCFTIEFRTE